MSAKSDLAAAASEAEATVAQAANEASRVIAAAASEALKVITDHKDGANADHDILIEVRTKLEGIKSDIRDLKDGTSKDIANHEKRIGDLEEAKTKQVILTSLGVALLTLLSSLMFYHLVK